MLITLILPLVALAHCPGSDSSVAGHDPSYYSAQKELARSR